MMYFLSKTVGRLIEPIGFIWLVLLIACVRAVIKKDRRQAFFTGTLALFITLVGSTKLPATSSPHSKDPTQSRISAPSPTATPLYCWAVHMDFQIMASTQLNSAERPIE